MVRSGTLNELSWERLAAEICKVLEMCTPDGCFIFFDILDKLHCSYHVNFFAGVDLMKTARAAKKVKLKIVGDMRPVALAGLCFKPEQALHLGGSLARDVRHLMQRLEWIAPTAEMAYDILKSSGAWRNALTWTMLIATLQVGQELGFFYAFTWGALMHAQMVTAPHKSLGVTLANQGVEPAEIGQRIKEACMDELASLFDL
jgi:hypothetical protein